MLIKHSVMELHNVLLNQSIEVGAFSFLYS